MNFLRNPASAGALAGAFSGIAVLGSGPATIALILLAPLPLMVATMIYGQTAGAIGTAVAIGLCGLFGGVPVALGAAFFVSLPAVLAGALASLARPASEIGGPDDSLVWFPLADVVMALALTAGAAFAILSLATGIGPGLAVDAARALAESYRGSGVDLPDGFEGELATMLEAFLPIAQASGWFLALLANLYLAFMITRRSGLLARPKDDWPTALRLPQKALFPFAIFLFASFIPCMAGYLSAAFAGALGMAFSVAGIARLHEWSRGRPSRPFLLAGAYLALLFFAPLFVGFTVAGLLQMRRTSPVSGGPGHPPKNDH